LRGLPARLITAVIWTVAQKDRTGATGLEPATSGVTGRSWCLRAGRE
jgi:hypothetical protein